MSWVLVVESKHEEAAIPAFKASPSGIMCNSSTRAAGGNGANVGGMQASYDPLRHARTAGPK
jgi:hypothetical protein